VKFKEQRERWKKEEIERAQRYKDEDAKEADDEDHFAHQYSVALATKRDL
jgi:hypothetical protein